MRGITGAFDLKRMNGFKASRAGNVALMFALTAPLLLLAGGGVVDLGHFLLRKTQIQDAADAAALGSIAKSSDAYAAGFSLGAGVPIPPTDPQLQAQHIFNADKPDVTDIVIGQLSWTGQNSGSTINDTVNVSANFQTDFLKLIGVTSLPLKVVSTASSSYPPFIDFYLLLDNTPSMGLGATNVDISTLSSATANNGTESNCAFACHATNTAYPNDNTYAIARSNNVTLRLDVVRQATQQLMNTATSAEATNGVASEFRVAIYDFGTAAYTFGTSANTTSSPNLVSPLTTNLLTRSLIDAGNIDLETVPYQNTAYQSLVAQGSVGNDDEDTNFDYLFSNVSNAAVPSGVAGNGATALTPQKVLFVVTDGMVDTNNGGRALGPISQTTCNNVKNKGIKIAILYTSYLPSSIASDGWSRANVTPLLPQIAPALQACASPGLYYEVSPSDGISEAMQALFQKVIAVVKINS